MLVRNNVRPRSQRMRRTDRLAGRRKPAPRKRSLARFVRLLCAHLPEISKRYQVKSLGVFGSYVRGAQKPRSDLDVLIEFNDQNLSLLDYVGLENELSDWLGVKVDLVEKGGLKHHVSRRILSEVVWLQLDGQVANVRLAHRKKGYNDGIRKMTPQREYLDYFNDILVAMDKAERYVAQKSFDEFVQDELRIDGLTKVVENIGEATKHIPAGVRERYPQIDWKKMAGMRDHLAHGYFAINLTMLWETATRIIPAARPLVRDAFEKELALRRAG